MAASRQLRSRPAPKAGLMHEYRLTLGGVPTRAIEIEGAGPPALLLHGFCDSADSWRNVLELMRRRGRAAIAYDLPGFGYAKPSRHPGNLLDQLVAFTTAAVERAAAASGKRVVVAGNSLGGWTALRLAERAELPLAGIVPVAPAGIKLSPWFFRFDNFRGLERLLALPTPVPEPVVRATVERAVRRAAFGARERIDERFIHTFAFHNRDRRKLVRRIHAAQGVTGEIERPYRPELIEAPAVVVWGDRDRLCLPEAAAPFAAELGAKLVMVDRCGHLPQVETPEVVVEAIETVAPAVARPKLRVV